MATKKKVEKKVEPKKAPVRKIPSVDDSRWARLLSTGKEIYWIAEKDGFWVHKGDGNVRWVDSWEPVQLFIDNKASTF